MKTIGLIGGMSWESTATYYQLINETVRDGLGGLHSASLILYSVDFHDIEVYQKNNQWDQAAAVLIHAAKTLQQAGADFLIICTNTMHKVIDDVRRFVTIPILHIAELTLDELLDQGISKVALLGTRYTLKEDFYTKVLRNGGLEVLIPNEPDVDAINMIIFSELCLGITTAASKDYFLKVIAELSAQGAQAVILGCTEIGMLITQSDVAVRLFDTTKIHAEKAARWAMEEHG